MKPDHRNIEKETLKNNNYRKVLYTVKGKNQLVLMSLNPGEDIPEEVHTNISQFFRVESGKGYAKIDDKRYMLKDGFTIIIPPGSKHYIKNTSKNQKLKMYSIYSPENHLDGKIDKRQPINEHH
jgi:mannose-6-phosphate isomerase-like protein (cupin superfamily)